jgi:GNAT superfamily N-acetyltransferase
MPRVERAVKEADFDEARVLFQEYAASLGFGLEFQDFKEEMASFPGEYSAPAGCVLLAWDGDRAVGCVALRPLEGTACELKRLFVVPGSRGTGLGRDLTLRIVEEARRLGYERMRLDTVEAMVEANTLYASVGFRRIEKYRHNPLEGAVFMELDLR